MALVLPSTQFPNQYMCLQVNAISFNILKSILQEHLSIRVAGPTWVGVDLFLEPDRKGPKFGQLVQHRCPVGSGRDAPNHDFFRKGAHYVFLSIARRQRAAGPDSSHHRRASESGDPRSFARARARMRAVHTKRTPRAHARVQFRHVLESGRRRRGRNVTIAAQGNLHFMFYGVPKLCVIP